MPEPIVVPFRHGPFWNFSYLVACPETRVAAAIDPAWDVASILSHASVQHLQITHVLATHSHSDHVNGVREIVEATGAKMVAHAAEQPGIKSHFDGPVLTTNGDEHLEVGRLRITVLPTPGHSAGSVSFVAGSYVFTGDALNLAGPGTPGPEAGSVEALWQSTQRIARLPAATRIHPGHDSGPSANATIGEEKLTNPAFLANSLEAFLAVVERATGRLHRD